LGEWSEIEKHPDFLPVGSGLNFDGHNIFSSTVVAFSLPVARQWIPE
jgi:hypothetical protein